MMRRWGWRWWWWGWWGGRPWLMMIDDDDDDDHDDDDDDDEQSWWRWWRRHHHEFPLYCMFLVSTTEMRRKIRLSHATGDLQTGHEGTSRGQTFWTAYDMLDLPCVPIWACLKVRVCTQNCHLISFNGEHDGTQWDFEGASYATNPSISMASHRNPFHRACEETWFGGSTPTETPTDLPPQRPTWINKSQSLVNLDSDGIKWYQLAICVGIASIFSDQFCDRLCFLRRRRASAMLNVAWRWHFVGNFEGNASENVVERLGSWIIMGYSWTHWYIIPLYKPINGWRKKNGVTFQGFHDFLRAPISGRFEISSRGYPYNMAPPRFQSIFQGGWYNMIYHLVI